ncbi:MAG: hypothetical protein OXC30_00610 [Alphaproteobacteria bacterium]|nr:hypothetical protein [Alphaproteobacteria bacterium]
MLYRSLSPILLFVLLFLGCGIYFTLQGADFAFYKVSAVVCIMPALFLSVLLDSGSLKKRVDNLCKGFANEGIAAMLFIFFLAGAFSEVSKGIGSVQEAVLITQEFLPSGAILPGIFFVSCLISMALGTSMGVIGVVGPFAVELAHGDSLAALWLIGAVVSGSAFGDNLSLVSDTSIAASQTVGVTPKEKLIANAPTALIACISVIVLYGIFSAFGATPILGNENIAADISWWKLLPYVMVTGLALAGIPVTLSLFGSILFAALLGISFSDYSATTFAEQFKEGIFSMKEVAILSFFLGGIQAFIVRHKGLEILEKSYKNPYRASWFIAKISIISDIIFANNTIAILFSGQSVKRIAEKNKLQAAKAASTLDVFATATQCIIPHGAQILLASSIVSQSPINIMPFCFYPLALYVIGALFLQRK